MTEGFIPVPLEVALGMLDDDLSETKSTNESSEKFFKSYLLDLDKLFTLLATKKIQSRDVTVLLVMARWMSAASSRVRISAKKIAEILKANPNTVYLSIKRLRDARLIVKSYDKRIDDACYMISPFIFSAGTVKQRGFQIKTFMEAIAEAYPDEQVDDDFDL
jgi:hypothetical protein